LIGADGFYSRIRQQLHPHEPPAHVEGVTMFRGTVEQTPMGDGRTMFIAGNHDTKLVCYPISEEARRRGVSRLNWVAEIRHGRPASADAADWTRHGSRDFIQAFSDFQIPDLDVVAMFEQTESVLEYPMIDRDPLPWWTQGRVTLLGDAAHPMYPIGANGASQAILDARALTRALRDQFGNAGLLAYECERRDATSKVVLANRAAGPEQVLDIAHERVHSASDVIEDLISAQELEAVARQYRQVAGFTKTKHNPE